MRRTVAILCVLLALVLFGLGMREGEAPETARHVAHHAARTTRTDLASMFGFTADLRVRVEGYSYAGPIAGTLVRVGPVEATTDERGIATLPGVPWGSYDIVLADDLVALDPFVSVVGVTEAFVSVLAYRSCPGPVRIVDADGAAIAGAVVHISGPGSDPWTSGRDGWLDLDEQERICGPQSAYVVSVPDGSFAGPVPFTVEGTDPVVLTLPAMQEAEVWTVDPDGAFVDATLSGPTGLEVSTLAVGRYFVEAPGAVAALSVESGDLYTRADVPLDGAVHLVRLVALVPVVVHALCDAEGCPEVRSRVRACEPLGATEFLCQCKPDGDSVFARDPEVRSVDAPEGTTDVTLDLRAGEATVVGVWGGAAPVDIGVGSHGYEFVDSEFSVTLAPGREQMMFHDIDDGFAERAVEVGPGQTLDIGVVRPEGTQELVGAITADFSPEGFLVARRERTAGAVQVGPSGTFSLRIPATWKTVDLTFNSDVYGWFLATFPTDGPVRWPLSWTADRRGLADEDLDAIVVDTGDVESWADTGGAGHW